MNNITIKDFKNLLKTGASKFEGIVVSEGKISKGPYTFFITPLTKGEHKVDVLSCQYKSTPGTQKTYLGFVVDSSDVHFYSKVFPICFSIRVVTTPMQFVRWGNRSTMSLSK